jgi:putative ABC transport system ATP-binding protein
MVGLEDRMRHFPSQISGGEQQRVSLARAAVKRPRLLLCDEPTGALDYQGTGKLILSLLRRINQEQGSTVVVVTHNTAIGAMADG